MYSFFLKPGGGGTVQWRTYDGIKNVHPIPLGSITSPAYVRISRYQDNRFTPSVTFFSADTSPDGLNWTAVLGSTIAIDMGTGSYLAGVAATTGTATSTTPATLGNVTIAALSTPPPGICPDTLSCSDVGTGVPSGNQIFLNGTWRTQAAGNLYGVYDTFRFASQPFPFDPANSANGDGTISTRVVSQTGGGAWMRSGVMIRSGADPQAPYYGVFATPGNGVVVQWRTTQAGPTSQDAPAKGTTTSLPVWVLASRYTDTTHGKVYYTAYSSTDGLIFTMVANSSVVINLPAPLIAGIASESNSSSALAVATFDNVAQLSGSQPPAFICPSAWSCTDVGSPLPAGQDRLDNTGTWHEIGGGSDIWGTADSFHLVSQTLAGDGTSAAHVTAQQNTSAWAKTGPMMRATTDPGSPYYAVFVTPSNGIAVQWRSAQAGSTNHLVIPGSVPAYLRVGRFTTASATYYTGYTSTDGVNWTAITGSTMQIGMTGPVLAGFAITSHNQGVGSAVTLDSVAVAAGAPVPPGLCPNGWQCADINNATPAGGQTLSATAWTIQGGGGDIWGTADAFHYVWQTMTSDGVASAQLASQTNTSAWAKAGVMLRATTDPASPYYAIFVTPANGVVVQWRTAQGLTTQQVATAGVAPVYLKVTRTGTTFSAANSADGVTWNTVTNATVSLANLSGALLSGIAVTSHNTGALSTVVLQSVATGA